MPLLTGHEAPIRAITFSPDGHWLASGSNDKTARIWDMTVLERRHILQGHEGPVISVSFSPDGTRLATGSTDGTVRIWDVAAGTELHRPIIDPLRVKETRAVYHPGGKWLAASEGDKLLLIDTATYSPQLVEPDLGISNIAFSPDGNWLAVDSGDDNYRQGRTTYGNVVSYIRFWHARSNFQKEEAAFARCEKESSGIAFSPDSKVLTAAVGNTIIEWNLADIPLA
jgi:WD40 repeat protein